jgi:peptide/nickel transport system substrate-binding protein
MRRITSRWIAAASILVALGSLARSTNAARRPRYGGTLHIETSASEADARADLAGLEFETLVRLDDRGQPQPALAETWTHDAVRRRWIFTPRANVMLHNGSRWEPPGGIIAIPDDRPMERILSDLARPNSAVSMATGPFVIAKEEPGKPITLTAHGAYWGGRPYLDSIEAQTGRTSQQQALDFELGKADVIEVPVTDLRRLRQRNARLTISRPVEVLALVFDGTRAIAPAVQEAVALSIDRAAIQNVLLQREGEVSAALLPQWLSGYSFVFRTARDVARARQLGAGAAALTLAYERTDALGRSIAERIAVNATEAGLTLRLVPGSEGDVRLVRLHISTTDPETALAELAVQLKTQSPAPDSLYNMEKALLGGGRVVPLLHLPVAWQLSPKVHGWTGNHRWEDVWLDGGAEP